MQLSLMTYCICVIEKWRKLDESCYWTNPIRILSCPLVKNERAFIWHKSYNSAEVELLRQISIKSKLIIPFIESKARELREIPAST